MTDKKKNQYGTSGYFGNFGGMFVPEILMHALKELEENYLKYRKDESFSKELSRYINRIN